MGSEMCIRDSYRAGQSVGAFDAVGSALRVFYRSVIVGSLGNVKGGRTADEILAVCIVCKKKETGNVRG